MASEGVDPALVAALYRFAWALVGEEAGALALTQNVLAQDHRPTVLTRGSRAGEVALFSTAFRLHSGGETMPVPPVHDRVAIISALSLQHAEALRSDSLLKSFRKLELPQRAALVLFYTTQCSLHDIAAVLRRSSEETVAIISRGKAEWLHILEQSGARELPGQETP